eukprot:1158544-Pelagomonas_calceolata.AAC.1
MVKSGGQCVDLQASCGCMVGQMDEKFKEEQIGTLFVWIGALQGGGGWVRGAPPKNWHDIHSFLTLLAGAEFCLQAAAVPRVFPAAGPQFPGQKAITTFQHISALTAPFQDLKSLLVAFVMLSRSCEKGGVRCVMLGSIRGGTQVARECSGCNAKSLPASSCTPVMMGLVRDPISTLPPCPPAKSDRADSSII